MPMPTAGGRIEDGCLVGAAATRSPACVYGNRRSRTTIVLFGDSHAMQYFPALEQIAVRRRWRLVELTKAGCPPPRVHVVYAPARREYPQCDAWREHALQRIERERPALVVATASVQYRVVAGGRRLGADAGMRAFADGYAPTLRRLRGAAAARRRAAPTRRFRPGTSPRACRRRSTTCGAVRSRVTGRWPAPLRSARRSSGSTASA